MKLEPFHRKRKTMKFIITRRYESENVYEIN